MKMKKKLLSSILLLVMCFYMITPVLAAEEISIPEDPTGASIIDEGETIENEPYEVLEEKISNDVSNYYYYVNGEQKERAQIEIVEGEDYIILNGEKISYNVDIKPIDSSSVRDNLLMATDLTQWTRIRRGYIFDIDTQRKFHELGILGLSAIIGKFIKDARVAAVLSVSEVLILKDPYGDSTYMWQQVYARNYHEYKYVEDLYGEGGKYLKTWTKIVY